ncbi:unnamed protein product [Rotaria socialis]
MAEVLRLSLSNMLESNGSTKVKETLPGSDIEEPPLKKRRAITDNQSGSLEDRITPILSCCICSNLVTLSSTRCPNGHLMCPSCFLRDFKNRILYMERIRSRNHGQRLSQHKEKQDSSILKQLSSIQKFYGQGVVEDWLEEILEKNNELQLTTSERNDLIPKIFSGKGFIWYVNEQEKMSTFVLFTKNLLQYYKRKEFNRNQITSVVQQKVIDSKHSIIDSLRNQMMIINLEQLPKFNRKSKPKSIEMVSRY